MSRLREPMHQLVSPHPPAARLIAEVERRSVVTPLETRSATETPRVAMPSPFRHLIRSASVLVVGLTLWGCEGEQVTPGSGDLESTLPAQMSENLGGLRVESVDCVYLTAAETRCFAKGTGPAGRFELPVAVSTTPDGPVWEVAKPDVNAARAGLERPALQVGEASTVLGARGARAAVRVTGLLDPLKVSDREIPALPGSRYVGVRLTIQNRGAEPFIDQPQSSINLRLSGGDLVAPTFLIEGPCRSASLTRVYLRPLQTAKGCAAFEVPDGMKAESVAIEVVSSHRVLEWRLTSERT